MMMMPQQGQLADETGAVRADVLYYSYGANPKLYVLDDNSVSLALTARDTVGSTPDSVYHLNMQFIGEMANLTTVPEPYEVVTERHNYFLAHCQDGVLDVPGYRRVVYKEIYPGIDFHIYSNPWGPKFYFVLAPGAAPDMIRLLFTGQEHLAIDVYGFLEAQLGDRSIEFPQALAYQQIGGSTIPVSLGITWDQYSPDQVGFDIGTYDPSQPLILDISASLAQASNDPQCLVCATYFGDTDQEGVADMAIASNGDLFACGTTFSPFFPATTGAYQEQLDGTRDAFYSHFSSAYEHLYTTFYGGSGVEDGNSLAISADQQSVYLFGKTSSTNLGTTSYSSTAFLDDTGGPSTCFIARFSTILGQQSTAEWRTYFGSDIFGCSCLRTDEEDNVYLTGHAGDLGSLTVESTCNGTLGSFPVCNAIGGSSYFQGYYAGGNSDAFLVKFNASLELVHSTLFGGYKTDQAYGLAVDDVRDEVYIVGYTSSKRYANANCAPPSSPNFGFPLCNVPGGYFDNNLNASNTDALNDGYLACFGTLDGALHYSSYIAGDADELGFDVAVNTQDGKVYMAGVTPPATYATTTCAAPTGSGFPNCASAGQYHAAYGGGTFDTYLVKLDATTRALEWTTFIGSSGSDRPASLMVDEQGQLLLSGSTTSGAAGTVALPVLQHPQFYYQEDHADIAGSVDDSDGMVWLFSSANTPMYCSYFGGLGSDGCSGRRSGPDKLYLAGSSRSTASFPFECPSTPNPYCFSSYSNISATAGDCFYAQVQCVPYVSIEDSRINTISGTFWLNTAGQITIAAPTGTALNTPLSLKVWDARGRLIGISGSTRNDNAGTVSFSHAPLERGIYLVAAVDGSGRTVFSGKLPIP